MSDSDSEPSTIRVEVEEISLEVANERKQQGNDLFRTSKWNEALVAYRAALNCLPKRPNRKAAKADAVPGPPGEPFDDHEEGQGTKVKEEPKLTEEEDVVEVSAPAVDEADKEARQLRAVLNANIGACFMKLVSQAPAVSLIVFNVSPKSSHKEAVEACSQALLDDPNYVKALERRASANDILNTWASLTSVQEDYNKLLTLITSSSQLGDIRRKQMALKPRLETAQKKETDEMLSKLKGLGNSLLGNFGLSTDNFQFVPNGQGGYSMNFNR